MTATVLSGGPAAVAYGCIRIPMDVANIFPGLVPRNGIPVYVRARG